jgi:hypothetical protein
LSIPNARCRLRFRSRDILSRRCHRPSDRYSARLPPRRASDRPNGSHFVKCSHRHVRLGASPTSLSAAHPIRARLLQDSMHISTVRRDRRLPAAEPHSCAHVHRGGPAQSWPMDVEPWGRRHDRTHARTIATLRPVFSTLEAAIRARRHELYFVSIPPVPNGTLDGAVGSCLRQPP